MGRRIDAAEHGGVNGERPGRFDGASTETRRPFPGEGGQRRHVARVTWRGATPSIDTTRTGERASMRAAYALCRRGDTLRTMDGTHGLDLTGAIEIVTCHAEGEVGDVIVGGVDRHRSDTLGTRRWIDQDETLRNLVLNEPRGGVFRHVNLLVPSRLPDVEWGFIIMEPCHTPPMSGSNSMCVATVLLETGRVPMVEPITRFTMEAPGGTVSVEAECRDGKAERIRVVNLPSFADRLDATLDVPGIGPIRVDTAFGGDSFVLVDAADLGLAVEPGAAAELAEVGALITAAANEQLGFSHPQYPEWTHLSFCQIAGRLERTPDGFELQSTSVIDPGKLDRSPTGTGVSARLAVLHARGLASVGDRLTMRSVIGSTFVGSIDGVLDDLGDGRPAVLPSIRGRAWITGVRATWSTHRSLAHRLPGRRHLARSVGSTRHAQTFPFRTPDPRPHRGNVVDRHRQVRRATGLLVDHAASITSTASTAR